MMTMGGKIGYERKKTNKGKKEGKEGSRKGNQEKQRVGVKENR